MSVYRTVATSVVLFLSAAALAAEPAESVSEVKSAWTNESELGVVAASGNASAQTYQVKQSNSYTWTENLVKLSGHYLYGKANGIESAQNWDAVLRYERALSETLSIYGGTGWDGDRFIGYNYRANVEGGAKYFLIPGDKKVDYLTVEAGYRYASEHRIAGAPVPTVESHFVRGYVEGVKSLAENVSGKIWVEALPDLNNRQNFQLNFETSVSAMLSKIFSLKMAYGGKYRDTPILAANKRYDSLFITALVAKL